MADKVAICNRALSRLKAPRITTLDDGTSSANILNIIYDQVAEDVMAMGSWPSVLRRAALAQITTAPAFEYSYAYQLPTDPKFLGLVSINEARPGDIKYTIEGDQLLCNESSANIKYLAFVSSAEQYDVYLRQAITDYLVSEIAYGQTGQSSAYERALSWADKHAAALLAKAAVGSQSSIITNTDTFLDARLDIWPDQE